MDAANRFDFLTSFKNDWFIFNLNEVENKKAGILSNAGLIKPNSVKIPRCQ